MGPFMSFNFLVPGQNCSCSTDHSFRRCRQNLRRRRCFQRPRVFDAGPERRDADDAKAGRVGQSIVVESVETQVGVEVDESVEEVVFCFFFSKVVIKEQRCFPGQSAPLVLVSFTSLIALQGSNPVSDKINSLFLVTPKLNLGISDERN